MGISPNMTAPSVPGSLKAGNGLMMRMKIALVNKFLFEHGGQEAVMLEEARLLSSAGHAVALWGMHHPKTLPNLPYAHFFAPYVNFSNPAATPGKWAKLKLARQFVRNPQAGEQFRQFLAAFKPDVIHAHGIAHQLTPTVLTAAQQAGVPVVQTLHDYQLICPSYTLLRGNGTVCSTVDCQSAGQGYWPCVSYNCIKSNRTASILNAVEMTLNTRPFTQGVAHFIGPSRFLVDLMQQHGIRHISHITNCVVPPALTDVFDGPNLPARFVLYAGRLSHEKGLFTLMEAARQVPDLPLLVVGSGPEEATLKALAPANVSWLGFQPRHKVMALLQKASAMVLPSEWFENAPMSIIEAQLMGTPVIAAAIGGLPEMVQHGQTGWLFKSRDVTELTACLQAVASDPEGTEQKGHAAEAFARQTYQPEAHLQQLLQVYRQVLGKIAA
jgi:glycosyltransferase involved in cell wall biosynthesis